MKQLFLGYRTYSFKNDNSELVEGVSLFTQYVEEGITGYCVAKLNVSSVPDNVNDYLGAEIDVEFNQRGKVRQINWPVASAAAAHK